MSTDLQPETAELNINELVKDAKEQGQQLAAMQAEVGQLKALISEYEKEIASAKTAMVDDLKLTQQKISGAKPVEAATMQHLSSLTDRSVSDILFAKTLMATALDARLSAIVTVSDSSKSDGFVGAVSTVPAANQAALDKMSNMANAEISQLNKKGVK